MYVSIAHKVCSDWRDIALTIRDKVFEEDEEQLIDIHDIKVSEPEKGHHHYYCKYIFGNTLSLQSKALLV